MTGFGSILKLESLPPYPAFEPKIRRAPSRGLRLEPQDIELALANALRYIPKRFHEEMGRDGRASYHGRIMAIVSNRRIFWSSSRQLPRKTLACGHAGDD